MRKINVFIASDKSFIPKKSQTEKSDAIKLQTVITKTREIIEKRWNEGVVMKPWWEDPNFNDAGNVLDTVQKIAHEYDIGIFVFGKDIKLRRLVGNKTAYAPNSNVLIELGMFKILGKKVYIIKDKNTTLPSDINNRKTASLERIEACVDGIVRTIESARNEAMQKTKYNKACVLHDIGLSNSFVNFNHNGKDELVKWETKALYVGTKSASIWDAIEKRRDYTEYLAVRDFISINKNLFKELPIDNVFSFGPGSGKIDGILMGFIPDSYYIPIDLNVSLAIMSMEQVAPNAKDVPFAIVDDFEKDTCYTRLKELIESKRYEIGKNNLFSMLGVTFSNLSMSCISFFNKMSALMNDDNDYLLLDVIIYDKQGDVLYKDDDEIEENVKKQIENIYWSLVKNTISKKRLNEKMQELDKSCLEYIFLEGDEASIYTAIPNTKVVSVCYKESKNIIMIAKHYRFDEIKNFISDLNYFEIISSKKDVKRNRGIFLLKKKV